MSSRHTAILFFSHRPEREWHNKWFVRQDYAKNRQVADALYRHTLRAAKGSGLPVLEVSDAQQRGRHFGARLANAFADAFAQGYERVIAVGSDCPRLHEVDWRAVAERLEQGVPVLGPTPSRDGVYLIGLTRAQFDRQAFAALPWQSPDLFAALARHLSERSAAAPALLAARNDVNGHDDLVALVRTRPALPHDLVAKIRAVLGPVQHVTRFEDSFSVDHVHACRSRAPPSFLQQDHRISSCSASTDASPGFCLATTAAYGRLEGRGRQGLLMHAGQRGRLALLQRTSL